MALVESANPDTGLLHPREDLFKPGATVTIVNGPLAGLEAIFKAHDGEARSIILLELLGKTQQLKIDRDHLLSTPRI
jgi:transcriptional antiterminator RfaH